MRAARIVCILCPNGCELDVRWTGEPTATAIRVEGNLCPRGEAYALEELIRPVRTLTTSVVVRGGIEPLTSVKTTVPIPRDALRPVRDALRAVCVDAPVEIGHVLARDVGGTGADVVVTRAVARAEE